jgi:phage head maturation protease
MNSGETDRRGERLIGSGGRLAKHVPLIDHHMSVSFLKQLGRVLETHVDGDSLVGLVRFSQANPDGPILERMVAEGTVASASVGFEPFAWEDGGETSTRERGQPMPYPKIDRIYTDWEIVELSVVGVPSNDGALVKWNDPILMRLRDEIKREVLAEMRVELNRRVPPVVSALDWFSTVSD